jgi:osmotically-inducible protein OsmY
VPIRVGVTVSIIVIVAAALLSSCRTSQAPLDDSAITTAIKAKLTAEFGPIEHRQERQFERGADQQTVSFIEVQSSQGAVVLNGEVRSPKAKARAAEIAKSVTQVVSVDNRLAVAPQYSDDAAGAPR